MLLFNLKYRNLGSHGARICDIVSPEGQPYVLVYTRYTGRHITVGRNNSPRLSPRGIQLYYQITYTYFNKYLLVYTVKYYRLIYPV